eukprot:gene7420-9771_t
MDNQNTNMSVATNSTRPMRILSVQDLHTLAQDGNISQVQAEFSRIPKFQATYSDIPSGAQSKNRYLDIIPTPHSRVPLSKLEDEETSTYINANFVSGYDNCQNAYIAAQGPLPHTIWDFWRMICEQKCRIIVMTTGLVEKGRNKCAKYWPQPGITMENELITITALDDMDCGDYILTKLKVDNKKTNDCFHVSHFWFTSWPDHGVPEVSWPLLDFVTTVRKEANRITPTTPIVVHCSAGIGRSGAFICLDMCMQQLQSEWRVCDIFGTVFRARQQRGGIVQVADQYVFIHRALADYVTPGHSSSMFGNNLPRDVGLIKPSGGNFGFTLRGSFPPFVIKLDRQGIAKANGIKLADHILAVNQQDTTKLDHSRVVDLIRNSGDVVTLTVISKQPLV